MDVGPAVAGDVGDCREGDERQCVQRRREAEAAQQRARVAQLNPVHDRYRLAREQQRGEAEQVGGARRVSDAAADPGERAPGRMPRAACAAAPRGSGQGDDVARRVRSTRGTRTRAAGAPRRAVAPRAPGSGISSGGPTVRLLGGRCGAGGRRHRPSRPRRSQASSASPAAGAGRRRTPTGRRWSIRRRSRARRRDRCRRSRAASYSGRAPPAPARPARGRMRQPELQVLPLGGPAR
jgi:hypothetical protein